MNPIIPATYLLFLVFNFSLCHLPPYYSLASSLIKSQAISTIQRHISNAECISDLTSVASEASRSQLWALKMLDASAKMNSGLLNGNIHFIGDYDQCLSISQPVRGRTIDGQYCTLMLNLRKEFLDSISGLNETSAYLDATLNVNVSLFFGVCVPRSCSAKDFANLTRHIDAKFNLPVQISVIEQLCSYREKTVEITKFDTLAYCFFIVVFLIVVLSTIYDIHLRHLGRNENIFVSFSAYTNTEKLFSQTHKTSVDLSCMNGIKVVSSCWVILGHLSLGSTVVLKNPLELITKWRFKPTGMIVWSAVYSVTDFFTISGFLVSYLYLKYSEKMPVNLITFYLGRVARLTPAFLATTLIHTSVLKLLVGGPYGQFALNIITNGCNGEWWKPLFYFLNLSTPERCVPQSWFLSVDTKLYFWAPLILFFIKKYSKVVLTGTALAIVVGIVYSAAITIQKKLGVPLFAWSRDLQEYLYLSPLYHSPCWLMGIVLGYMLYQNKIRISRNLNLTLWIVIVCTMSKLVFGQSVLITEEYNVYRAALWNGLAKPLWSLCVCFAIFSCATGNGGFINTILSNSVFNVLGKLTYSIYLTHVGVLIIVLGNSKETSYISYFFFTSHFFWVFFATLACSILLYLAFEAPIMALKYHADKCRQTKTK